MKSLFSIVEKFHLWIFSILLFLTLIPLTILQGQSYITIHDNLDGEVPNRVALVNSGAMFNYQGKIDQVMNGLPREALTSGLNVVMLLFYCFPPLTAIIINYILVHIIAFIGMYLLLKTYILKEDNLIASGVAFCFSFLPFYAIHGLSIAGLPFLLFAILSIKSNNSLLVGYLIIILFPIYSSLFTVGFFILITLSIWLIIDFFRKKPTRNFLIAIFLLGIFYFFVESNLIISQIEPTRYVSHRSEWIYWVHYKSINFSNAFLLSLDNLVNGQTHAVSLHRLILLFLVPITYMTGVIFRQNLRQITLLLVICLLFSFSLGFVDWNGWLPIKERITAISILQIRFYWLSPLLWYMIFALGLNTLLNVDNWGKRELKIAVIIFFIVCQTVYIGKNSIDITENFSALKSTILNKPSQVMTFDKFYSEELFNDIREVIGKPQASYRVVNIGLFPGISQYNGFYNLDSYQSNYPLDYKKNFRKVIATELEKNSKWKLYFDSWGNRCYFFVAELDSVSIQKQQSKPIQNLQMDVLALKEIIQKRELYVFSTVMILNFNENDLDYLGYFNNNKSPWGIYLYKLR